LWEYRLQSDRRTEKTNIKGPSGYIVLGTTTDSVVVRATERRKEGGGRGRKRDGSQTLLPSQEWRSRYRQGGLSASSRQTLVWQCFRLPPSLPRPLPSPLPGKMAWKPCPKSRPRAAPTRKRHMKSPAGNCRFVSEGGREGGGGGRGGGKEGSKWWWLASEEC
jgi:hypothetical protein